jgi:hypothetical protein
MLPKIELVETKIGTLPRKGLMIDFYKKIMEI